MFDAIIVVITYFIVCSLSYKIIKFDYIKSKRMYNQCYNLPKLRMVSIIAISSLFTFYNWFITFIISHNILGSDRTNYRVEFLGERSVGSTGLQFIFNIVKKMGGDIYSVIYLSTFICIFLTLIAYRKCKKTTPRFILLLFMSEYIFFIFTTLKQAYAAVFASLFFVNIIDGSTKKNDFLSFIEMILSIMFHSSGMILIPLFFIMKIKSKNKDYFSILTLMTIIFVIFLPQIMIIVNKVLGSFMPILSNKIEKYFILTNELSDNQWYAVFKYLPFGYIPLWAFFNRRYYSKFYHKFDSLLISSVIGGLIVMYSAYVYWFSRFRFSFIFPVYFMYDLIDNNTTYRSNKIINNMIVYGGTLIFTLRNVILIFIKYGAI